MPPHSAETVLQTIRQNHGTHPGKLMRGTPGNQSDHPDFVPALAQPLDKERETPFGSSSGVASWVYEEHPHHYLA
jgi:hypothetical protein